jgi:hypothetical protein
MGHVYQKQHSTYLSNHQPSTSVRPLYVSIETFQEIDELIQDLKNSKYQCLELEIISECYSTFMHYLKKEYPFCHVSELLENNEQLKIKLSLH